MMKKNLLFTLLALLLLSAQAFSKELTISTNSWIGYTPLFYANEKGYLKDLDIKLINSDTLAQAAVLYENAKADMVTTTQYEYHAIKKAGHSIIPVILFDRSNGADLVLSNKSITQLQKAKKIEAYLKTDSINAEVLEDFIRFYHLDRNKITFINKEPSQLQHIKAQENKNILVVTFVPYNMPLEKNGFKVLASTKDTKVIVVVDSLCTNKKTLLDDKKRLKELKKILDKSIVELQSNKKASYKLVKSYLQNISYGEYLDSLKVIKWINKPSKNFIDRIKDMGYNENQLIK